MKMKHLPGNIAVGILAFLPPMTTWAADARWTYIAAVKTGDNLAAVYLRLGTPSPPNKMHARVWELYSNSKYQRAGSISYKSEMNLQDYDCASEKAATLSQTLYDGEMGTGSVLSSRSAQRSPTYSLPVRGTLEYVAMQAACSAAAHAR